MNSPDDGKLVVAAIGDLHVQDDEPHPYRAIFAEIAERAHVLALCGDLTNLGTIKEAEILAEDIITCGIPVVGVLGNHDYENGQAEEVARILCHAGMKHLNGHTFEYRGVGFAGAKGFAGGFGRTMLSPFGEGAIKAFVNAAVEEALCLEKSLHSLDTERNVVVLHYAPIAATCQGESPEILPFLGSSRLADTIDRFPVNVVFHGHAHHGKCEGRTPGGVPVYNCARTVPKADGKPYILIEV